MINSVAETWVPSAIYYIIACPVCHLASRTDDRGSPTSPVSYLPAPSGCCGYAKASRMTQVPVFRQLNEDLDVYKQTDLLAISVCVV